MDDRDQTTMVTLEEVATEILPESMRHSICNIQLDVAQPELSGLRISVRNGTISVKSTTRLRIGRAVATIAGILGAAWAGIELFEWLITKLARAGP